MPIVEAASRCLKTMERTLNVDSARIASPPKHEARV